MFSKDQSSQIEKTSAHLLSHWSIILKKGPPTHGQTGLSGLVVGGPKWYDNLGPSDPKINACQDPD